MLKIDLGDFGKRDNDGFAEIKRGVWQSTIIALDDKIAKALHEKNQNADTLSIDGYLFGGNSSYAVITLPGHVHRPISDDEHKAVSGRFFFHEKGIGRVGPLKHLLGAKRGDKLMVIGNHDSYELWTPECYARTYPAKVEAYSTEQASKPALMPELAQ